MSPSELLVLLGLAWPRLLIYPGGLVALLLASVLPGPRIVRPSVSAMAMVWLGLALLPLPFARPIGRKTDLIMVIALLEAPQLLALARELRSSDAGVRASGQRRLAAALNGLPPLVLSGLALAQAAGTFDLAPMMHPPAAAPLELQALHWLGAAGLALVLVPLVGIGPFAASTSARVPAAGIPPEAGWEQSPPAPDNTTAPVQPRFTALRWARRVWERLGDGMRLRALGLVAVASLPWLGPSGALQEEGPYGPGVFVACGLVPALLAALLWSFGRLATQPARRWAQLYLGLDALLLAALLVASAGAFVRAKG